MLPPRSEAQAARRIGLATRAAARFAGLLAAALGAVPLLGAVPALAVPGAVPAAALWRAQARGSVRVIVRLGLPAAAEGHLESASEVDRQRSAIAAAQDALVAEVAGAGVRQTRRFATIPFVALEAGEAGLGALEQSGAVLSVEEDHRLRAADAESDAIVEADQAWAEGFDGSGWTVAVVDTGVDGAHPLLAGKVIDEACFSANGNCPNGQTEQLGTGAAVPCTYTADGCAHGTHVAGIAVGSSSSLGLFGVARGATAIAVQVFSRFDSATDCGQDPAPCAQAFTSDIIAGLERVYALRDQHRIAAVNLSLGGATFSSTASCDAQNPATKAAIDNLVAAGIAVVVAAGNDGDAQAIEAPACISSAVSVGATTKSDAIASFSDAAPFLSLLAPGVSITSAYPGNRLAIGSGTSEATPHVSGAWAVVKQKEGAADVATVLASLRSSGLPIADARNGVAVPRIRIAQALAGSTSRQSGSRVTPDGKRTLISKDVGGDRWAITWEHDDSTLTGNVYPSGGGDPQFVWCQRTGDDGNPDPAKVVIQYSCFGATACASDSCSAADWGAVASVALPGSFLSTP